MSFLIHGTLEPLWNEFLRVAALSLRLSDRGRLDLAEFKFAGRIAAHQVDAVPGIVFDRDDVGVPCAHEVVGVDRFADVAQLSGRQPRQIDTLRADPDGFQVADLAIEHRRVSLQDIRQFRRAKLTAAQQAFDVASPVGRLDQLIQLALVPE